MPIFSLLECFVDKQLSIPTHYSICYTICFSILYLYPLDLAHMKVFIEPHTCAYKTLTLKTKFSDSAILYSHGAPKAVQEFVLTWLCIGVNKCKIKTRNKKDEN